nr:tripartite tricarboxylate transporter substrate-binding protein [uncultured Dongia sp.]
MAHATPDPSVITNFAALDWQREAAAAELFINGNPFRRPTRAKDLPFIPLDRPLCLDRLAGNSALALHRLLFNAYESDLLFLPRAPLDWQDFDAFYGAQSQRLANEARPQLEHLAFAGLERDVELTGPWSPEVTLAYFQDFLATEKSNAASGCDSDPLLAALINARDPQSAARHYLVQMAPDFLAEASAMARLAPGAYGPLQSALFNVLIDEYGADALRFTLARMAAQGRDIKLATATPAAGTPATVVSRLNAEVNRILGTPAMRERVNAIGGVPTPMSPEQFAAKMADDGRRFGAIIRARKIVGD